MIRTFRPWTHTSDDSYIYQLSLVVATATIVSSREDFSSLSVPRRRLCVVLRLPPTLRALSMYHPIDTYTAYLVLLNHDPRNIKHIKVIMKPTNSPPTQRPTPPKKDKVKKRAFGPLFYSPQQNNFFVGWDWFYIGNRLQDNLTQRNSPQTPYYSTIVTSATRRGGRGQSYEVNETAGSCDRTFDRHHTSKSATVLASNSLRSDVVFTNSRLHR